MYGNSPLYCFELCGVVESGILILRVNTSTFNSWRGYLLILGPSSGYLNSQLIYIAQSLSASPLPVWFLQCIPELSTDHSILWMKNMREASQPLFSITGRRRARIWTQVCETIDLTLLTVSYVLRTVNKAKETHLAQLLWRLMLNNKYSTKYTWRSSQLYYVMPKSGSIPSSK